MEQLESKSNNFTKSNKIITLEKGKLPPQAVELEEAVLGAMMIDKKGLDEIIDILSPQVFYKKEHQFIYEAIEDLFKETEPIDILTISNKLRSHGKLEAAGGDFNLIQLSNKVSSSAHIEYHSRIILEKYILRKLIEISSNMIEKSYDETSDVFDLLDYSESQLYEITNGTLKRTFNEAKNLVSNALKKIKSLESKQGMSGIPSGFKHVDKITAGWQPSDLIIVAARPGMGKTAFILSMARNIAISSEVPIGIFSLEMSAEQLMMRMISSETGIESEKLRKANLSELEWQQLYSRVNKLEKAPIFIDDSPGISVFDLRAKARRLVSQHGVRIIMIDYLQLMSAGGKGIGNREQEIATISRSLKAIAKELEIPVIALSQLSRSVETRGGSKKPLLSDLRESGAIEQDADIVTFIYRPEYYKLETWEDGTPCSGQGEFIIAKHRNGALEDVKLKFTSSQAKFSDLDDNFYSGGDQGNDISTTFESRINDESSFESSINLPSINPSDSFGIDDNINDQDADMPF